MSQSASYRSVDWFNRNVFYQTGNTEHTKIYSELLDIFKFLRTNMLVENDEWMQRFGRVIWPQFAESIIVNRLRKVRYLGY